MPGGSKRLERICPGPLYFNIRRGSLITNLGHLPAAPGAIGNACVQRYLLDYRDRDHSIDSALLFAAEFKKTLRHQPEPLNSPRQCSLICVQEN